MVIQYVGFQLKPRGREYAYRVVDMKNEAREFTLTISNQAFVDRHVPYQDAAAICYQKLQKELSVENTEEPLRKHFTITDEELEAYLLKYRPAKRRGV